MRLLAVAVTAVLFAGAAVAQGEKVPPNTINCNGFQKLANGDWHAKLGNSTFDLGPAKGVTVQGSTFGANGLNVGGQDLAAVLDNKCGY